MTRLRMLHNFRGWQKDAEIDLGPVAAAAWVEALHAEYLDEHEEPAEAAIEPEHETVTVAAAETRGGKRGRAA